jgi:hypothetical protein
MTTDGDATMLEAAKHSHVDDDGIKAFLLWKVLETVRESETCPENCMCVR